MKNFFEKLLMMKELTFKKGEIILLKNRAFIASDSLLIGISDFLNKNPKFVPAIYSSIKLEHSAGWGTVIKEKYAMNPREYMNFMFEISSLAGWGESKLIKFDGKKIEGVFRTYNAPVGTHFEGRVKKPTDHLWRATGAGTGSAIFGQEMEWVETKCRGQGDPYCEISFFLRKNRTKEQLNRFKDQIFI